MDSEHKSVLIGLAMFFSAVVLFIGCAFSYNAYAHYLVSKEMAAGVAPMVAACAHNTQAGAFRCEDI